MPTPTPGAQPGTDAELHAPPRGCSATRNRPAQRATRFRPVCPGSPETTVQSRCPTWCLLQEGVSPQAGPCPPLSCPPPGGAFSKWGDSLWSGCPAIQPLRCPTLTPTQHQGQRPGVGGRGTSWQISEAQYAGRSVGGAFLSEVEVGSPASIAQHAGSVTEMGQSGGIRPRGLDWESGRGSHRGRGCTRTTSPVSRTGVTGRRGDGSASHPQGWRLRVIRAPGTRAPVDNSVMKGWPCGPGGERVTPWVIPVTDPVRAGNVEGRDSWLPAWRPGQPALGPLGVARGARGRLPGHRWALPTPETQPVG